jgi:hypothetical protein
MFLYYLQNLHTYKQFFMIQIDYWFIYLYRRKLQHFIDKQMRNGATALNQWD